MKDLVWSTFDDWKGFGMVVMKGEKGTFQDGKWMFNNEQVTILETPSQWYERQAREESQILIRSYERRGLMDRMNRKDITKEEKQALYEQLWRSYE